jgi:hypothetical protein
MFRTILVYFMTILFVPLTGIPAILGVPLLWPFVGLSKVYATPCEAPQDVYWPDLTAIEPSSLRPRAVRVPSHAYTRTVDERPCVRSHNALLCTALACAQAYPTVPPPHRQAQRFTWRCACVFFRIVLWSSGCPYSVVGLEHLDPEVAAPPFLRCFVARRAPGSSSQGRTSVPALRASSLLTAQRIAAVRCAASVLDAAA